MTIIPKVRKPHKFQSRNFLKRNFTNISGLLLVVLAFRRFSIISSCNEDISGIFCSVTYVFFCCSLILPVPILDEEKKINLNLYFHTSLWFLKMFYEGL